MEKINDVLCKDMLIAIKKTHLRMKESREVFEHKNYGTEKPRPKEQVIVKCARCRKEDQKENMINENKYYPNKTLYLYYCNACYKRLQHHREHGFLDEERLVKCYHCGDKVKRKNMAMRKPMGSSYQYRCKPCEEYKKINGVYKWKS